MINLNNPEYTYLQKKYADTFSNYNDFSELYDPNTHIEPEGDTLLHCLAYRGDFLGCAMLLNAGAAVDEAGDMGYTPLQYAIKQAACLDTVLLFIQKGSSFSIENEFGHTALFELLETGLDLSDVCNTKWTNKTALTQLEITYIEQSLGIEINVNNQESMKKALIASIKESNLVCLFAILKHGVSPLEPLSDSLCVEDEINKLRNQMPFSVSNFDKVILSEKQSNRGHLTVEQKQVLFWYSIFLNRRLWLLP